MKSTPIIPNGREQKCREPRNLWPFSPVNGEIKLRLEYLRQNRRFKPGQIDITHLVCPPPHNTCHPIHPSHSLPHPPHGLSVSQTLHHPQSVLWNAADAEGSLQPDAPSARENHPPDRDENLMLQKDKNRYVKPLPWQCFLYRGN